MVLGDCLIESKLLRNIWPRLGVEYHLFRIQIYLRAGRVPIADWDLEHTRDKLKVS